MEWFFIALALGGGGFTASRWRRLSARRAGERQEVEAVRRLADEDVTILGEQLARLGGAVDGLSLDEQTRTYYQTALDAYESAQRAVPRIRQADEVSQVTDTLSAGRYAAACVEARVQGLPVPERRVPCFFNPAHGPSVTEVRWTPPGRGTRTVPACAQDAARIAQNEKPEVRTVTIGTRRVPYWEAGSVFAPYGDGYFPSAALLAWAFHPPATGQGPGYHGGFDGGFDGGHGGFDGGFDGGGGDGGGGID